MGDDRRYLLLIGLILVLERMFGLSLLPAAILALAVWTRPPRFWLWVGFCGLVNDLLSGFPLGSWGLSFLLPIGIVILIFRVSRFRPQPILMGLLGFSETLIGDGLQNRLIAGAWAAPSPPMIILQLGWSFFFVFAFRFVKSSFWEEELVVRY